MSPLKRPKQLGLTRRSRYQYTLRSKELDLVLLAGCSCLMTLLHHPIADAFSAHSMASGPQSAITSQVKTTASSWFGQFQAVRPRDREGIKDEE